MKVGVVWHETKHTADDSSQHLSGRSLLVLLGVIKQFD